MSTSTDIPFPFSFGVRLGLVFILQTSCLSALAVLSLLGYIAYSALTITKNSERRWCTGTHVHWYLLSMLVSDLIQAIGGILNVKWVAEAQVTEGAVCTAQGILKGVGDVGVAMASLAIAIHTFRVLVFKWSPSESPRMALVIIASIWIFLALGNGINAATHRHKNYWGDTQYWCWITQAYPVQRILLEYLWLWVTSLLSIVLYIPIALVIKGVIVVEGWKVRWATNDERGLHARAISRGARDANTVARQMLYYPAVYIITVLPIAVVRWRAFSSHPVPFEATVFADVLFAASGLFNVGLISITRPSLLPHHYPELPTRNSVSFGAPSRQSVQIPNGRHSFISVKSPLSNYQTMPNDNDLIEQVEYDLDQEERSSS